MVEYLYGGWLYLFVHINNGIVATISHGVSNAAAVGRVMVLGSFDVRQA